MPESGDEYVPGTSAVEDAAGVGFVGAPASTGATDVLAELDALPVADHVARFEALHEVLRARLAGEPVDGGIA